MSKINVGYTPPLNTPEQLRAGFLLWRDPSKTTEEVAAFLGRSVASLRGMAATRLWGPRPRNAKKAAAPCAPQERRPSLPSSDNPNTGAPPCLPSPPS